MKTIVFSDVHLTTKFEPKKCEFLKSLINSTDQIIINGDFWDGYFCTFDDFIKSEWKQLFPLMKEKTIYVYGNHDAKELSDERVNLFSRVQTTSYDLPVTNHILHIEHGNLIMPPHDEGQYSEIVQNIVAQTSHWVHHTAVKILGPLAYSIYQSFNTKGKQWVEQNLLQGEILVTGHTHVKEIDLKNRFINVGFILHGYASWLEIVDGDFELKQARY